VCVCVCILTLSVSPEVASESQSFVQNKILECQRPGSFTGYCPQGKVQYLIAHAEDKFPILITTKSVPCPFASKTKLLHFVLSEVNNKIPQL
jgi:hypothetical protein